jgi:hypothetical protein
LPPKAGAKSGHKDELSKKEHAHYSDEIEGGVLAGVLADDDHFQGLVATLTKTGRDQRRDRAWEQARAYAPYDRPHRARIAELLLVAAQAEWEEPASTIAAQRRTRLINHGGRAVWADAPLEATDAQRVRDRQGRLLEGAFYVARFGAYKCVNCEAPLARDARSGRRHPSHCSPCSAIPGEAGRQGEAMRDAFDAGTDQRRTRRAKRRALAS